MNSFRPEANINKINMNNFITNTNNKRISIEKNGKNVINKNQHKLNVQFIRHKKFKSTLDQPDINNNHKANIIKNQIINNKESVSNIDINEINPKKSQNEILINMQNKKKI